MCYACVQDSSSWELVVDCGTDSSSSPIQRFRLKFSCDILNVYLKKNWNFKFELFGNFTLLETWGYPYIMCGSAYTLPHIIYGYPQVLKM